MSVQINKISIYLQWEYHSKVLAGTKKERNHWFFCVVKHILGQRDYESTYWPELTR